MTDCTPTPSSLAASNTPQNRRVIARRARIEYLAMELLRLANAVRLPVPVDGLWRNPPASLWPPPHAQMQTLADDQDDPTVLRYRTAREIAGFVSDSRWPEKERLLGGKPLDGDERHHFAIALLMPTALVASLSARQVGDPPLVAQIFQVPLKLAEQRLRELNHL